MGEWLQVRYYNWWLVGFYVLIVGFFILGILRPRKKAEWRTASIAQAWVIALYAEMYGLPLTMYLMANLLGRSREELIHNHFLGHLWPLVFGSDDPRWMILCDLIGNSLIVAGAVLAVLGWRQIHRGKGKVVSDGIYRHVRHPQYAGFYLVLIGSFINWPTLITLCMLPVLIWLYYRLARTEEAEALAKFGDEYRRYMQHTGMFLPRFKTVG
jgi:protein-S-isoprenylcysteine O-methyltransferase Ste14